MEGSAGTIPALSNLPPAISTMGAFRRHAWGAGGLSLRPAGSGTDGFAGGFCRWEFRSREKRGAQVGKTKRGKGTKIMAITDGAGLPLALSTASASPHEVTLVGKTLQQILVEEAPQRLIGDAAYDSDRLDRELNSLGIEMIAPHRRNRRLPTQDGRSLRRYRRRWRIERFFAWLQNFRRLVVRYEVHPENFLGMIHLGSILILLRHL